MMAGMGVQSFCNNGVELHTLPYLVQRKPQIINSQLCLLVRYNMCINKYEMLLQNDMHYIKQLHFYIAPE